MKYILFIVISLFLISCGKGTSSENQVLGEALGTTYQIIYFSEKDLPVEEALDSIFLEINQSMSTYQNDSDISKINKGDSRVEVDHMFREVFALSEKVYQESGGYFDPTVGELVNMYGFGPEKGLKKIDSSSIDSLLQHVGLDKIDISPEGKITKSAPEVYLDFNAIAKGYAIDVIGIYLERQNVENYLIELGGELLANGKNLKKGGPWRVGIDDPNEEEGNRSYSAIVELKDRAMATSGNYRKFRLDSITGTKYVHTINPMTGYPERSTMLSASVLAENCALADAYATAFLALGVERSKEVLGRLEAVDAYFIYSGENGEIANFASPGFEKVLWKE